MVSSTINAECASSLGGTFPFASTFSQVPLIKSQIKVILLPSPPATCPPNTTILVLQTTAVCPLSLPGQFNIFSLNRSHLNPSPSFSSCSLQKSERTPRSTSQPPWMYMQEPQMAAMWQERGWMFLPRILNYIQRQSTCCCIGFMVIFSLGCELDDDYSYALIKKFYIQIGILRSKLDTISKLFKRQSRGSVNQQLLRLFQSNLLFIVLIQLTQLYMRDSRSLSLRAKSPTKTTTESVEKPQTASSQFRSTNRQGFPFWAGRYNKIGVHDLDYHPNYQHIKGKSDLLKHKPQKLTTFDQRMKRIENMQKWIKDNQVYLSKNRTEASLKDRKLGGNTINPQQYKQVLYDKLEVKQEQENKAVPKQLRIFESVETKTIESRIKSRSDHHLKFDKQVGRQVNIYPVLYNSAVDVNGDKIHPRLSSEKAVHHFSSYEEHDVFRPAPISSAIYDWEVAESRVRPQSSSTAIDFKKMTKKKVLKSDAHQPPAFTRLSYDAVSAEKMVMQKILACKIPTSQPRTIEFTKQVISDRRGCTR